jgi:hypothetical protein
MPNATMQSGKHIVTSTYRLDARAGKWHMQVNVEAERTLALSCCASHPFQVLLKEEQSRIMQQFPVLTSIKLRSAIDNEAS